jgi:tRNA U34 5-carboxymethylaminomethyl modifying GTPase MnmE/TrmE
LRCAAQKALAVARKAELNFAVFDLRQRLAKLDSYSIPAMKEIQSDVEEAVMASQSTDAASAVPGAESFLKLGREQTEATFKIQKDVLEAYEEASRAWLARVQSEVDLWSQLAAKLAATRSLPEALGAYQESVAQRMQMAAEDGKRLSDDCREIMGRIAGSLPKGWPGGST